MKGLACVVALLGLTTLTGAAEAGSARSTFGVTAEVVRRCAIDTAGATSPDITCVRGTPLPRIGRASTTTAPADPIPASASPPRVLEVEAPGGGVLVTVDF